MISIRNFCTFEANVIDDSVEDEHGDIIQPTGRGLLQSIAALIEGASEPIQHSFYGWKFTFKTLARHSSTVLLQCPDTWLIIVSVNAWWVFAGNRRNSYNAAIKTVNDTLHQVQSISNIAWFNQKEYMNRVIE
jgi:hypothetical protein